MKKSHSVLLLVCVVASILGYLFLPVVNAEFLGINILNHNGLKLMSVNGIMCIPLVLCLAELFCVFGRKSFIRIVAVVATLFLIIASFMLKQIYTSGNYKTTYEVFKLALPIIRSIPLIGNSQYAPLLAMEDAEGFISMLTQYLNRGLGFWVFICLQALIVIFGNGNGSYEKKEKPDQDEGNDNSF